MGPKGPLPELEESAYLLVYKNVFQIFFLNKVQINWGLLCEKNNENNTNAPPVLPISNVLALRPSKGVHNK